MDIENNIYDKIFNDKKENKATINSIESLLKEQNQLIKQINFNLIQIANKLNAPEK